MTSLAQDEIRQILEEQLSRGKLKNSAYSLRALARHIDVHPGAVSEILRGRRRISPKLADRILTKLAVEPRRRSEILQRFKGSSLVAPERLALAADQHALVADWYHFAILSLLETHGVNYSSEWIANRLKIQASRVRSAIERLMRTGLLRRIGTTLKLTNESVSSPDHVAIPALRNAHRQNLELASQALENVPLDMRDFTAITMAICPEKLPEAKQKIRKFLGEIEALLEVEPKKEVYKMCVQLFPLTELRKDLK